MLIFITAPGTDDAPEETREATVISGFGEDVMVVSIEVNGEPRESTLTLVTSFTASDNLDNSSWEILQDGEPSSDTLALNADGSGAYAENGIVAEEFAWSIDSNGILVITLQNASAEEAEFSDHLYRLADSTADNLHAFVVLRADGELTNVAEDPSGPPVVVFEGNLQRRAQQ